MTFPVVYDPAVSPARSCQPGAKALMAWCLTNTTATNLGCYVNRPIRGSTRLSMHAEGRALDLGFPATHGGTPEGWALANLLRQHHAALGVQFLIYAKRQWTAIRDDEGWRPYSGASAHNEHIHCELNRAAADQLTPAMITATLGDGPMTEQEAEYVGQIQQTLVDAGINIGDFGPNKDGVDKELGIYTVDGVSGLANALDVARKLIKVLEGDKTALHEQLATASQDRAIGEAFRATLAAAGWEPKQ